MVTQSDIAYAAGLFDGEGCITYNKTKKSKVLRVQMCMVNLDVIKWMKRIFGGNINGPYDKGGNHPQYYWHLSVPRGSELFLRIIVPYLIEKKDKAIEAIKFCEERKPRV